MAYDKAKWHFDAADFPKGIAIEQGGVHIAFFYRWMLEHDFAGEDLLEDMAEELALLKAGTYSALDLLFEFNDGVLLEEDFNEVGAAFANEYYSTESNFSKTFGDYLADYSGVDWAEHLEGVTDSAYGICYSDVNYAKIKPIIDQRYQEFLRSQKD